MRQYWSNKAFRIERTTSGQSRRIAENIRLWCVVIPAKKNCEILRENKNSASVMAMGKNYKVLEKNKPEQPHSIILEHRARPETLLFESQAVANLCKKSILSIFSPPSPKMSSSVFLFHSCSRDRSGSKAVCQNFGCLRMSGRFTA